MALYAQSVLFSEYHSFPSSGSERNWAGTRVYDNAHTIYIYNQGSAAVFFGFYIEGREAFDLNTVSDRVFKVKANSTVTVTVGSGASAPGARLPLYSIETGGSTTEMYVSYLCRNLP